MAHILSTMACNSVCFAYNARADLVGTIMMGLVTVSHTRNIWLVKGFDLAINRKYPRFGDYMLNDYTSPSIEMGVGSDYLRL